MIFLIGKLMCNHNRIMQLLTASKNQARQMFSVVSSSGSARTIFMVSNVNALFYLSVQTRLFIYIFIILYIYKIMNK